MKRASAWAVSTVFLLSLSACADLKTIGRRTMLPLSNNTGGIAIHLDAQQRLVVYKALGQYCAEPSPDALAAYASALGLGVSAPSQGAASLASASQSSAGSIGLRTQSITLMRDALYRMCEAYMNGALGPAQVATLLGRSQDLTAVILAVEQLTGVVAANQVILTGTAGAGASASLLSNQQLLDAARKNEEAKAKSLEEAKKERESAEEERNEKKKEVKDAEDAHSNASDEEVNSLKAELDRKKAELNGAESKLTSAENQVKAKEERLDDARQTREAIEAQKDAALTDAVANTSSAGQFSIPVPRKELSKDATEAIAAAVHGMVTKVLDKEYTQDSCMALLTYVPPGLEKWTKDQQAGYERVRDLCMQLVSKNLFEVITKTETTFGPDATTDQFKKALDSDLTLRSRLDEWLKRNGLKISSALLLYGGAQYAPLRERALKELTTPGNP